MNDIRWDMYPLVAANAHGRHWLTVNFGIMLANIDNYVSG